MPELVVNWLAKYGERTDESLHCFKIVTELREFNTGWLHGLTASPFAGARHFPKARSYSAGNCGVCNEVDVARSKISPQSPEATSRASFLHLWADSGKALRSRVPQ